MVVLTEFWPLSVFSFVAAVIALAYYRFTKPGEVLAWWGSLLRSFYYKATVKDSTNMDTYIKYEWILKPILTCETCIAGQVSFWLYLTCMPLDLLSLLYVVGLSSYLAPFLLKHLSS